MERRRFLQTGTGAALALLRLPRYAEAFADTRTRVGLIGSGWYGKCDLFRLIQVAPVEVVSLCDVDKAMLADAAQQVAARQASKKTPRTYGDYRKMLAEKDLDLVVIATPDHWHALTLIEAVKAGADVYLQKPISVDVRRGPGHPRGRAQVRPRGPGGHAAAEHAAPRSRRATRSCKAGRLGKVGHVEIYCYYHMRTRENPPDTAPPESLDWEMYTGPAPCARTTSSSTRGAGGPSWSTATASWATCASTCSTPCAG